MAPTTVTACGRRRRMLHRSAGAASFTGVLVLIRRLLTVLVGSALVARVAALLRERSSARAQPSPAAPTGPPATATRTEPTPPPAAATPSTPPPEASDHSATASTEAAPAAESATAGSFVEAVDGECPEGYPIRVKVASGIYHEPGGTHYGRVKPDRCYPSTAAAEADGFRSSKS